MATDASRPTDPSRTTNNILKNKCTLGYQLVHVKATMEDLPDDLLLKICSYDPYPAKMSSINKRFNKLFVIEVVCDKCRLMLHNVVPGFNKIHKSIQHPPYTFRYVLECEKILSVSFKEFLGKMTFENCSSVFFYTFAVIRPSRSMMYRDIACSYSTELLGSKPIFATRYL